MPAAGLCLGDMWKVQETFITQQRSAVSQLLHKSDKGKSISLRRPLWHDMPFIQYVSLH